MLPGIGDTIRALGIPLVPDPGWGFITITVISLTTGTLFLMWLGDQITERGIGNGISLIITVGIVARLPAALAQAWKTFVPSTPGSSSQVNPIDPGHHGGVSLYRDRRRHHDYAGQFARSRFNMPSASLAERCTAAARSICR